FLLQGIFPTQGSNLSVLHWQVDSLPLSNQRSPLSKCSLMNYTQIPLWPPYPILQLVDLLLPALQGQLLSLIQAVLQVLHRLLQVLHHPLQVAIGMVQLDFHLIEISLHLLLDSQGIIPAPDLSIQCALHGLHNSNVVPLQLFDFLIFFSNFPVHFRLDLVQLQLDTQDLSLFMFKRCLNKTMIN
uniref:Uncharacterized protein n=1 Tax=Bos indicus x Bos taurus TaxID=30522 RepID=A0A4W2DX56_BOBOX